MVNKQLYPFSTVAGCCQLQAAQAGRGPSVANRADMQQLAHRRERFFGRMARACQQHGIQHLRMRGVRH
jgi:hypothetical protein